MTTPTRRDGPGALVAAVTAVLLVGVIMAVISGTRLLDSGSTGPTEAPSPAASARPSDVVIGSTGPSEAPAPAASAGPSDVVIGSSAPPPSAPDDCSIVEWQSNQMVFTVEDTVSVSSTVLVAEIAGLEPARWNTPDGRRPKDLTLRGSNRIYRPVDLTNTDVLAGGLPDGLGAPQVEGGMVGCDEWTYSPAVQLDPGQRYVLFLSYSIDSDGHKIPEPAIVQAWSVAPDGIVTTAVDGKIPLEVLTKTISTLRLAPWPATEP